MESPEAYIPIDRRLAMAQGRTLPDRTRGTGLFADLSGFTALTDALVQVLGPRRGAEELPTQLNRVYDAMIAEVHRYGGTVIGFAGDAITCWFDGDDASRATACALAMQQAMQPFAAVPVPGAGTVALAVKVAIAAGSARRFVVGDPAVQRIDVLAGATLDRLAAGEHHAERGEVLLDAGASRQLGARLTVAAWRAGDAPGERFAVVTALAGAVAPTPWPALTPGALDTAAVRAWLLPPVYERLQLGRGEFLTELRPGVSLFLRFGGIDYDRDAAAGRKLDAYVRWVQTVLTQYGGYLIQLTIGDKGSYLYAAFGAPVAHPDDASRAVAAALELRRVPPELACIRNIQIGISQGRMRTGAYGSTTRRTYGVLGPDANLAARLMQQAAPGEVLVSRAAQEATGDAFVWERLPEIMVKGKAEPVRVFRLLGAQTRRAVRLQEPRYAVPMVGRQAELAVVTQRLADVLGGRGQVVAITAEAGMGKSRLVAEIVRVASERGLVGYAGEAQSYGTHTSYLVWQSIWREFFGLEADAPLERQVGALERALTAIDPALVARLPLLGSVLNLPIADNELTASFDAKLRKASLEALLVDCLRVRARTTALLLVLEDCHWIDPLSNDLLEAIGRALVDLPVLVVLAYRPPEMEQRQALPVTELPQATVIALTEFTPEEAARLIRLKLEQAGIRETELPGSFLELITERAQGNPFYIEELLNYLRDQGIDPRNARALEELDLPTSLHSLILSRIDQLTESQKVTLKVASIIGRLFKADWLWGAHPDLGDQARVKADLEALHRLELTPLDQPEPEFTYLFKHIITREVAYESLPYALRALLHGQLGAFIEERYADTLEQYVDLLAHHYHLSENDRKKREYLRKAGEAAQANYANMAAIDYYRRLLPLLPEGEQVPAMLDLGQVLQLVGEWGEASNFYRLALTLTEQLDDRQAQARAQSAMGDLLRKQGQYTEASAWLERAQRGFEDLSDSIGVSRALSELGEIYRLQGQYNEARTAYEKSLALVGVVTTSGPSMTARAAALKGAGIVAYEQGDYAAGQELCEESLELHRKLGDKPGIANLINNLGVLAAMEGDYATARNRFEESLALRRELGDKQGIATSLTNLGRIAHYQGDFVASRLLHQESLEIYRQLGTRKGIADSLNNQANAARDQGDYNAAHPLYRESLVIYSELGDKWAIACLLEDLGGLAAAEAQREKALRLAGAAAALREVIDAPASPDDQAALDRTLEPVRQSLGKAASAAIWEEGRTMTIEQAIAYALEEHEPVSYTAGD